MLKNDYLDNLPGWKLDLTRGVEGVEHQQHMKILEAIINGNVAAGQTSSVISNNYLRELWHHLRRTDYYFGPRKG